MIEISMTLPGSTAAGSLHKFAVWVSQPWRDRQARASLAGMSEREFQDIGWGQPDRWESHLSDVELPEDRRARAIARKAWLAPAQKAA